MSDAYPSDSKTAPDGYPHQPDGYPQQFAAYPPQPYPPQPYAHQPDAYPPEPKVPTNTYPDEPLATTSTAPLFPEPTHEKAHHDDGYGYHDASGPPTRPSTDSRVSLDEAVADNLPEADHPTIAILIPFPQLLHAPTKKDAKVPPFLMYAPLAAPLPPPKEGEKQSWKDKAIRKWQKEETEARAKKTGLKAKAVGVRGCVQQWWCGAMLTCSLF